MRVMRPRRPKDGWQEKLEIAERLLEQGVPISSATKEAGITVRTFNRLKDLKTPGFQPKASGNQIWSTTRQNLNRWYKSGSTR